MAFGEKFSAFKTQKKSSIFSTTKETKNSKEIHKVYFILFLINDIYINNILEFLLFKMTL